MIRSFRSRSLAQLWEKGDFSKLPPDRIRRIRQILEKLDASAEPEDMNLPGFAFHKLSGRNKDRYAVSVSANWRITYGWDEQDAIAVDFEDYH